MADFCAKALPIPLGVTALGKYFHDKFYKNYCITLIILCSVPMSAAPGMAFLSTKMSVNHVADLHSCFITFLVLHLRMESLSLNNAVFSLDLTPLTLNNFIPHPSGNPRLNQIGEDEGQKACGKNEGNRARAMHYEAHCNIEVA